MGEVNVARPAVSSHLTWDTLLAVNISPFHVGDFVRIKADYFRLPDFDPKSSPLREGQIGIVTSRAGWGDRRPRYVRINGKSPLFHHNMFEPATPPFARRFYLSMVWFRSLVSGMR